MFIFSALGVLVVVQPFLASGRATVQSPVHCPDVGRATQKRIPPPASLPAARRRQSRPEALEGAHNRCVHPTERQAAMNPGGLAMFNWSADHRITHSKCSSPVFHDDAAAPEPAGMTHRA